MANKTLKKLGLAIGRRVVGGLSQDMAIDLFAHLSQRLGISSVVAAGRSGRFEGHPDDRVSRVMVLSPIPRISPCSRPISVPMCRTPGWFFLIWRWPRKEHHSRSNSITKTGAITGFEGTL